MGLLLRPDAHFVGTTEGLYLLTHQGEWTLTGASAGELMDRLAPFLDGRHTLHELTRDLSGGRRAAVETLVNWLTQHGAVRDLTRENRSSDRLDVTTTVVVGEGPLSRAVSAAVTRSGLGTVRTVQPEAVDRAVLAGADLVLHATEGRAFDRARLLDELCDDTRVPIAQALVFDGRAWITSGGFGDGHPGGSSGWRRLMAWRGARTAGRTEVPVPLDGLAVTYVAIWLVHHVLELVTGTAAHDSNPMTSLELSTMGSESGQVLAHPYARRVAPVLFESRISALREGSRLAEETFSRRAVVCTTPNVGIFTPPTEREYAQVPMHVCEATVADPVGLLGPLGVTTTVIGVGSDFAAARHDAAQRALTCYASLMLDPRRLDDVDGHPPEPDADPSALLSALRHGRLTGRLCGIAIDTGAVQFVDVTQVFPALRSVDPPFRPPVGAAAAYDWSDALARGVLAQCLRLTMTDMATATAPFPEIDVTRVALDARGTRLRSHLAACGLPVRVCDVTGPLGVPTMVCFLGSDPVAAGCALTATGAVTDALEQGLLSLQARMNHQPEYAPAPMPAIPHRLVSRRAPGRATRSLADRTVDLATCVSALRGRGFQAIAVPLDHDPEVNAVLPYIVNVVLVDA